MNTWLLLGMVVLIFAVFWAMLSWIFSLIDAAHERLREDSQADRERGH